MAQEHQEENSVNPANHNARRKRGRPRKDDAPGSESFNRTRRRKVDAEARENDPFVGQIVSGVLDGRFDAGYMLTVRVGDRGSVLRGLVFEPGLSVPISAANDIAPNVKMFKRNEVSLPSAQHLPCFTPLRSRKDGVLRHQQRNDFASSKGLNTDTLVEDPDSKVQMHCSVDIQRLPENGSNHASGNLKQDLQPTVGVHASKDGIQNLQSANASAECSRDIHVPEIVSEEKLTTQLSQTTSESKQAAISDGRPGLETDNKTANFQEVLSDMMLHTQTSQSTSEAKRTVETLEAGPVCTYDNKMTHLQEVVNDAKPVTEDSQIKTSDSKQPSETCGSAPVFTNGASGDHGEALPPVFVQTPEHIIVSVAGAKLVTEFFQAKTSETELSAETSDAGPVFKNGASDDFVKALPPVTVRTLGQPIERVTDAEPITEVSQTKMSVFNQAAETSDSGHVSKNGASDDYGKALHLVSAQMLEEITDREPDAKAVTEVAQSKASETKQSAETSDSGPVFTSIASVDYFEAPPPVTVQTSDNITYRADDLCEAPQTIKFSGDESGAQTSAELALNDGMVEVSKRTNNFIGHELQVQLEPLWSESNKPVELSSELLLMDGASTGRVIPEQLHGDLASPCGARNEAYPAATGETTDRNPGRWF